LSDALAFPNPGIVVNGIPACLQYAKKLKYILLAVPDGKVGAVKPVFAIPVCAVLGLAALVPLVYAASTASNANPGVKIPGFAFDVDHPRTNNARCP